MKIKLFSFQLILIISFNTIKAQIFSNFSSNYSNYGQRVCLVETTINTITPSVTINFLDAASNTNNVTSVYRRALNNNTWTVQVSNLPAGTTSWTDNNVVLGDAWEYQVRRTSNYIFNGTNYDAIGYTCAALLYDQTNYKGQMILLVAQSLLNNISTKITRLKKDLTADGWFVNEIVVSDATNWDSGTEVVSIKNQITSIYNNAPLLDKPKALFIVGHVPLPRSGSTNVITPDDHEENAGARGADSYYADVNGVWTDAATFSPAGLVTPLAANLPNDFKLDQDFLPSDVEMAFGRIDFKDLTDIGNTELFLTEQYLDRLHNYKTVAPGFFMGSKSVFDFGYDNSNDQSLRCLPNISGINNVYESGTSSQYNAAYLNANGPFAINMQNSGVPEVTDWQANGMPATIFSSDQSYWGFGDVPQNNTIYSRIRSLLAVNTKCLITLWTTTAANQFHQLAIGETFGESLRQVINHNISNNRLERPFQQYDTPDWLNRTHMTMYGDPTLRIYQVYPASNLSIISVGSTALLSWSASIDASIIGYHIYKSSTEFGKYIRLTNIPISNTSYSDATFVSGNWYMVRVIRYQTTGSGTFKNASAGIFVQGNFTLPVNLVSFTGKNIDNANILHWITSIEFNNDRFEIERSEDGINFYTIGSVNSKGNNSTKQAYEFYDTKFIKEKNYYRLLQIDVDGKKTYFDIVSIESLRNNMFSIYPNPATDEINILTTGNVTSIEIYNAQGAKLYQKRSIISSVLDIRFLTIGNYILRTVVNGSAYQQKFIKK